MRVLDVSRVRSSFAEVIEGVSEDRDVIVIVRYGKPLAAIVPMVRLTREERGALVKLKAGVTAAPLRRSKLSG